MCLVETHIQMQKVLCPVCTHSYNLPANVAFRDHINSLPTNYEAYPAASNQEEQKSRSRSMIAADLAILANAKKDILERLLPTPIPRQWCLCLCVCEFLKYIFFVIPFFAAILSYAGFVLPFVHV